MKKTNPPKHFLDTSVARPILLGTNFYKKYFSRVLGEGPHYISPYVRMEIARSYFSNVVSFWFVLKMPTISTLGDAMLFWANKYPSGAHKALEQFLGALFDMHQFSLRRPRDKEKALRVLGVFIKRQWGQMQTIFKDISQDATRCARAQVPLKVNLNNMAEGFSNFNKAFCDTQACRKACWVDRFLLERYGMVIKDYASSAAKLSAGKKNDGFKKVGEALSRIVEAGSRLCSCRMCGTIGDAIIALDAPREMQLDHTDYSFDHLCEPISQLHQCHPSEVELHKRA